MFRTNLGLTLIMLFSLSACITTPSGGDAGAAHADIGQKGSLHTPASLHASNASVSKTYSRLNFGLLAPLIGEWQVQDWQLQKNGEWQAQAGASWRFYPIQGGMSLEDEWLSQSVDQNQIPGYGTHLRVFEPLGGEWQAVWLSSRSRTLEFYRGMETDAEVYFLSMPNAKGRLTRTVFSNIGADFFNWRMQWSNDGGASWLTVYKVDATRTH